MDPEKECCGMMPNGPDAPMMQACVPRDETIRMAGSYCLESGPAHLTVGGDKGLPPKQEIDVEPTPPPEINVGPDGLPPKQEIHVDPPHVDPPHVDPTHEDKQWDSNAVYTKGNQALYEGELYTAKWWTKGENPSKSPKWGVWMKVGPEWDKNTIYNPNDSTKPSQAIYNGILYTAKWWT